MIEGMRVQRERKRDRESMYVERDSESVFREI